MKATTQERIDRVLDAIRQSKVMSLRAQQDQKVALVVEQILREQDRDTRHACAEAVNDLIACDGMALLFKSQAHSTILNTQSI